MTQPQYSESAPAPVENVPVWEDFMDIFYAPAQVFRRRIDGNWFVPLIVVTVAMVIVTYFTYSALRPVYDAEFDRTIQSAMRANPQLTPDMLNRMRGVGEFMGKFGVAFMFPVMIVIVALLSWIVGKAFGSQQTFSSAMMVAGYAQVPRVIGGIVMGIQGLLLDPTTVTGLQSITIGPSRFIAQDSMSPVLYAFITRLDVFTIWSTVLLAIGLHVTGKISKASAAAAAFVIWLVGSLPMVKNMLAARG